MLYSNETTTCFREKWIQSSSQSLRPKGPSRLSLATEAKANVCHGMGVQQSKRHGWLGCVWRYHWHEGIYWDCTETYTAIKMMSFMGRPWLLYQDNVRSHSAYSTTAWFRRPSECAGLTSRSDFYWTCMDHHEKENQTTTITDCWASEVKRDWTKLKRLVSPIPKQSNIVIQMKVDVTQC